MLSAELNAAASHLPTSYVWLDVETSGLDSRYDQVLAIAAIKTGVDFEITPSPDCAFESRVRRSPSVVPSPAALMTTGIDPASLDRGPYQHAAMFKVHETFARWSPAIFIGFNNMAFDESFLRQSFYRSLLPPFQTQRNDSTRADVLKIAHAIAALQPSAISISLTDAGRRTFRLAALCSANGVRHSAAHDAMSDVRATIALATQLRAQAPDVFAHCLALADRDHVTKVLAGNRVILRLQMIGGASAVQALAPIGRAPDRSNTYLCADLGFDPADYVDQKGDALRSLLNARPSAPPIIRSAACCSLLRCRTRSR